MARKVDGPEILVLRSFGFFEIHWIAASKNALQRPLAQGRSAHSVCHFDMKTYLAAMALCFSALSNPAQNVSVDFNTPGLLANDFNIYQNATPGLGSPYAQFPIRGLIDVGGGAGLLCC